MKNHLFEDENGVIHSCHLSQIGRDTNLAWTDCQIDVPENTSFRSYEQPTCKECAIVKEEDAKERFFAAGGKQGEYGR